uniref:Bm8474 n=1 Tax=Brugia malayi TaxID=6279 RepID=A0A0J9YC17_BRUMA|nr:Bm8474 [Brugia malayi]
MKRKKLLKVEEEEEKAEEEVGAIGKGGDNRKQIPKTSLALNSLNG